MIVLPLSRLAVLVTDNQATPQELEPFRAAGIEIIQVLPMEDQASIAQVA
jgi:hypothetical protein